MTKFVTFDNGETFYSIDKIVRVKRADVGEASRTVILFSDRTQVTLKLPIASVMAMIREV